MKTHTEVLQLMSRESWRFANGDEQAYGRLGERLAAAAVNQRLLTYSELVDGILFRLPTVEAQPLLLGVPSWEPLHRAILGDFLGRLAVESYQSHRFLISAIAVQQEGSSVGQGPAHGQPSLPFFELAKRVGLLRDSTDIGRLEFWQEQVRLAYAHFTGHRSSARAAD